MAPTIHFVRHAQGYHNLSIANHGMHDPLLTPYGKSQCTVLQHQFPYAHSIDLVVASPIKRTIYTALLSFEPSIRCKGLTVLAMPELQETSDLPCDTGSPKGELEREFAGQPVDLSLVVDGWDSKTGKWAPTAKAIEERCRVARQWLMARKEEHIVVVTHGGVLHYLTEDWEEIARSQGTGWTNTEFRSYTFDTSSGDRAMLVETQESRTRRKGSKKPLTEAEQRNLRASTTKEWEDFGMLKKAEKSARNADRQPQWSNTNSITGPTLQAKMQAKQGERDFIGGL